MFNTWCGRKVNHVDCTEGRVAKVVRHMKAGIVKKSMISLSNSEVWHVWNYALDLSVMLNVRYNRIPSRAVLEACRPSYVKYCKRSEFGECSACKPAYHNLSLHKSCVVELISDINLPATASLYVRTRVCLPTIGKRRHKCEENRSKKCLFINYCIADPEIAKKDVAKFGSETMPHRYQALLLYSQITVRISKNWAVKGDLHYNTGIGLISHYWTFLSMCDMGIKW